MNLWERVTKIKGVVLIIIAQINTIQVRQSPIATKHQVIMVVILYTNTETDACIPALEGIFWISRAVVVIFESLICEFVLSIPNCFTISIDATFVLSTTE